MKGTVSLSDLYEKYHEQVQFLVIYIREAHPVDGWWMGGGVFGVMLKLSKSKAAVDVYDPTTMDERRQVASRCESTLTYDIPTLVDDMDDSANQAYAALPTRIYFVDEAGMVAYAGGPGPWGFKPAELQQAIEAHLSER